MTLLTTQTEIDSYLALGRQLITIFEHVQEGLYRNRFKDPVELDTFIEQKIIECSANPIFKGFAGFPAASCISVNSGVVHCIPSSTPFVSGDVVSVDMGMEKDGWVVDAAFTFVVGEPSQETIDFLTKSYALLRDAVGLLRPDISVKELSKGIEEAASHLGLTVIPKFTGHALGRKLHEDPLLPNVATNDGTRLPQGSIVAIEPITAQGSPKTLDLPDKWSTRTADGKLAAHYEESVVIGEDGPLIATPMEGIWASQQEYLKNIA